MIRVLILTEGGGILGWGHVARCCAITQGLEKYGCLWEVFVNAQGDLPSFTDGSNWSREDWRNINERLAGLISSSDYVIVDSYITSADIYQQISSLNKNLVVIDDNNRISYPPCIVVNPNVYGDHMPYADKYEVWAGLRYILLREPFWNAQPKPVGSVHALLLVLGGGDSHGLKKEILRFLVRHYPLLKKYVVVCVRETSLEDITKEADGNTSFFKNLDARAMCDLMGRADMAISAGGQTLGELTRLGVPTVAISLADNQKRNIAAWQAQGFVQVADEKDSVGIQQVIGTYIERLNSLKQDRNASHVASLVDGQGVKRLVENLIGRRTLSLRRASLEDCEDIWRWRNDVSVRKSSFSQKEIPFDGHKKWFAQKMNDPGVIFYIAQHKHEGGVGQVRFEIQQDKSASVHVNMNPQYIGRGLGAYVIAEATRTLMKERPTVLSIRAEVLADNIASRKVFEKAGYQLQGNEIKEDKQIIVFSVKKHETHIL
ncbi:MAG: UDP-2,4-diacetamido-2,4,6-trideoxy-beta-L-altropyranose hydrolase [Candidatus Omnitrophica bacterium]|nr:UDP-2,4-diacetamido-2,4,6-trideoxy-beta-L-altropyranose hydrolase [Candidatus Omnitrophota bacterium]